MIRWELFFKLTNYMVKMLPRQKRIRETKRNEEIYDSVSVIVKDELTYLSFYIFN